MTEVRSAPTEVLWRLLPKALRNASLQAMSKVSNRIAISGKPGFAKRPTKTVHLLKSSTSADAGVQLHRHDPCIFSSL